MNNNFISYLDVTLKKYSKVKKYGNVKSLFANALKILGGAAIGSGGTYSYMNKDKIGDGISNAWNVAKDITTHAWDNSVDTANNIWDRTKGLASDVWDTSVDAMGNTWNTLKQEKVVGAGIGAVLGASLEKAIKGKKTSGLTGAALGGLSGIATQYYLNNGGLKNLTSSIKNLFK